MPEITISQNDPMGLKDSKLFGKIREGHQPLWNQSSATPEPEQKIENEITISQNDPMGLKDSKLFEKIREGHQPLWNQSSATPPEPGQKIEKQPDKISTNKYGDKGFE